MSSTHWYLDRTSDIGFRHDPWFFLSLSAGASQGVVVGRRAFIAALPVIHGAFLS